jgi:3'(2'), 5'-bisphosphate nucleotidase
MKQLDNDSADTQMLLVAAIKAAVEAGNEIMKHYTSKMDVDYKSDDSPLTIADRSAHNVIAAALQPFGIPLLSEEGKHNPYAKRKNWKRLWIVDPLDGTKEFIKQNGEFTVNIALVENQKPVMGVVYCPPLRALYFSSGHLGKAFKITLSDTQTDMQEIVKNAETLPLAGKPDLMTVVASKSHLNEETSRFINQLESKHGAIKLISKGSSLKFCLIAEGTAAIYPRFAPTYEWDTAAAQAIVEMSGGAVISNDSNAPLIYNKENLLNPGFTAYKKKDLLS